MADVAGPPAGARRRGFERACLGIIAAAVVLVLLIQARAFLIPLVIAILLFSFAGAIVDALVGVRLGALAMPRWVAGVIAALLMAAFLFVLFVFASGQIDAVRLTLPAYIERGQVAVARLFSFFGDDVARAVLDALRSIDAGSYIRAAAGSAGSVLTAIVMIALYVGFLFAERPYLRPKLAQLLPESARAARVAGIVASIRRRVHHYLLVKAAISALTALVVYAILRLFKLDFAEFLAVLTFLLNFIPVLGSIIATIVPVVIALVQFDSLPAAAAVLVAVGAMQFLLGSVLDPMMMGRALRMSSFAIILSLTFWSAVWGVVGMFVAVPIMIVVLIVCAHIPPWRPLAVMLSRDGALPTEGEAPRSE
jgi:predicted PurR-regulated permease PerM